MRCALTKLRNSVYKPLGAGARRKASDPAEGEMFHMKFKDDEDDELPQYEGEEEEVAGEPDDLVEEDETIEIVVEEEGEEIGAAPAAPAAAPKPAAKSAAKRAPKKAAKKPKAKPAKKKPAPKAKAKKKAKAKPKKKAKGRKR